MGSEMCIRDSCKGNAQCVQWVSIQASVDSLVYAGDAVGLRDAVGVAVIAANLDNENWVRVGVQAFGDAAMLAGLAAVVRPVRGISNGVVGGRLTGGIAAVDEAAAGPVNFMGNSDQFFKNASKRLDVDANGTFDVVAHGSTQRIEVVTSNGTVLVDQRVAAKLIENSPGYNGQPIRLLSCDTGACDAGFAQNLANKMGVSVEAPTNLVWAYGNGKLVVAPRSSLSPRSPLFNVPDLANQGTFRVFVPGKTK